MKDDGPHNLTLAELRPCTGSCLYLNGPSWSGQTEVLGIESINFAWFTGSAKPRWVAPDHPWFAPLRDLILLCGEKDELFRRSNTHTMSITYEELVSVIRTIEEGHAHGAK